PTQPLALRSTHTVLFTTGVRTALGAPFAAAWSWQFTTIGVRHVAAVGPADGATFQSPVAPLIWTATDPSAGPVEYRIASGADSAAVAAAAGTTTAQPYYLPVVRWNAGAISYWKVSVRNLDTGDEDEGP